MCFVIDIKDNTTPAYNSPVMKEYSITNYNHALNDYETYKGYVKKAKDAGLYVIGRITTFKDSYYVEDHKETAIKNSSTGDPFSHNGSYWPSAYNRDVWEFNVSLGVEAVKEIGFNEIQFDYVRFPIGSDADAADYGVDMTAYTKQQAIAVTMNLLEAERRNPKNSEEDLRILNDAMQKITFRYLDATETETDALLDSLSVARLSVEDIIAAIDAVIFDCSMS